MRNTRTLDYGYDSVGNRKWAKRDGSTGDVFGYDFEDQVTAVKLNVANPSATPAGTPTIVYDANGNLRTFQPYGPAYTYTTNYLNQYTQRNAATADYDKNGNMKQGFDGSAYTYDAQNRLLTAPNMSFTYDGLNRQVSRTAANGVKTYSVWDGWNLVQEYHMSGNNAVEDASYLYGATGVVKELRNNRYYYQDGNGSTSHLASSSGSLLEWYRYDLQGTPIIYDANNTQRTASAYDVRHLFTGQQWYKEIGLYDLRNRFYSPDIGRFLQPDPIGFRGDRSNLYRYCGNNPVTRRDPSGLDVATRAEGGDSAGVVVTGTFDDPSDHPSFNPGPGFGPGGGGGGGGEGGGPGGRGHAGNLGVTFEYHLPPGRNSNSNTLQNPPPQNPPSSSNYVSVGLTPTLQALVVTLPNGEQYMPMTTIKNLNQGRRLGKFVDSMVPIFVPPGVDPQGTIMRWRSAGSPDDLNTLGSFFIAFRPGGPGDFALRVSVIYDAYGNFIYGASGIAVGYTPRFLQGVANGLKGGQNDPINVYDIQSGIDAAMMGGVLSTVPVNLTDF